MGKWKKNGAELKIVASVFPLGARIFAALAKGAEGDVTLAFILMTLPHRVTMGHCLISASSTKN